MAVSATFNVGDLRPYVDDEIEYGDLRANPFKGKEDDTHQGSIQGPQPATGKSMLTDHLNDQFCEGKQCSFDACLGRSFLCWIP